MSERALPTQIPLNPCSVAAECVVPPGETLPEGLITGHPVCAKPRWLPRCLPHNGRVVWAPTRFCPRRCDAVHKPGTPSACRPQLLLSFSTRNSATRAPPPGFVIIPVNVSSAHPSGRTCRNVLTCQEKYATSVFAKVVMELLWCHFLIFFFFGSVLIFQQLLCVSSNINTRI